MRSAPSSVKMLSLLVALLCTHYVRTGAVPRPFPRPEPWAHSSPPLPGLPQPPLGCGTLTCGISASVYPGTSLLTWPSTWACRWPASAPGCQGIITNGLFAMLTNVFQKVDVEIESASGLTTVTKADAQAGSLAVGQRGELGGPERYSQLSAGDHVRTSDPLIVKG